MLIARGLCRHGYSGRAFKSVSNYYILIQNFVSFELSFFIRPWLVHLLAIKLKRCD